SSPATWCSSARKCAPKEQRGRHAVPSISLQYRVASDRQDRDDPVGARIDDYDLVVDDEVFIASPTGIDLDQPRWDGRDPHTRRNRGSDAERDVHVCRTRCTVRVDDGFADLGL